VVTETLRLEHVAEPVRFCEIAPGMVRTESSAWSASTATRRSATPSTPASRQPLVADDVAEAIRWVASLPAHVSVDELVIRPKAQAAQHKVHRTS
jgi:NADP-dependent 3-hydroxy acid dehydrogenase YdfG